MPLDNSLDSLFTITCGQSECRKVATVAKWSERPICGELPRGEYQCPHCGFAFRRERHDGESMRMINGEYRYQPINLVPISARL